MLFLLRASLLALLPMSGNGVAASTFKPVDATPQQLLQAVRSHYQILSGFSMTIHHQDSSGLYPGVFTQKLEWKRGGHFILKVVSPGNKNVPDFKADGRQVVSTFPDGRKMTGDIQFDPNTSPGWEVTGGMIVSFLQGTPTADFFLHPPKGMKIAWSVGPRSEWQGIKVKELLATLTSEGHSEPIHLFIDKGSKRLIGFEWKGNGKLGYAVYADQKDTS